MASGSNGPLNNWLRGFFAGFLATFAVTLKMSKEKAHQNRYNPWFISTITLI